MYGIYMYMYIYIRYVCTGGCHIFRKIYSVPITYMSYDKKAQ